MQRRRIQIVAAFALIVFGVAVGRADAATCVAGKPAMQRSPDFPKFPCHCFDKDPAGTRVYEVDRYEIDVATSAAQNFLFKMSIGDTLSCDDTHLYSSNGTGRRVFPLAESTVRFDIAWEQAIFPNHIPDQGLARLIKRGTAKLIMTM